MKVNLHIEKWPRYKIGYRTLKTALGAGLSIGIASLLGLDFYSSAAIITILCISVTRKHSLAVSWARILACVIALLLSAAIFELLGYNPFSLSVLLLLYIPLVVMLRIQEGLITSCVILLHLYVLEAFSWAIFFNELLLILIGVGVALLMNLYMPSEEKQLRRYRREIEEQFSTILNELATFLKQGDNHWDGKEINETDQLLKEGKQLARRSMNNHILKYDDHYYQYFNMREKQFEVIERLMPFVSSLHSETKQSKMIAKYIEKLSKAVSPNNYVAYFLEQLEMMRAEFKEMELPQTRNEFETRSTLLYIVYELEQYLRIKDKLWNEVDKSDRSRSK
ncbi:aromatic acid exporter family protein [Alkalihalobacillus alcalophilus]|uniref:Putative fusaric acid efflux transporter n=1 Tax=Alkalihalobacillus alcalophilus ATCC 27647 = CGMCC 1.3604 TaxID=1218173 RepID=K4MWE7_ALKAL|nr:putative fusaric acid efflux transporter [Alkalihalobacillus alcalophilus ATCC 27647 = CGMCC 1.3604]